MTSLAAPLKSTRLTALIAVCVSPAVVIFVSSNFVNVGNLAFNMLFSRWMGPALFGDLAVIMTIKLGVLGLLGALQMAVSQMVAARGTISGDTTQAALARINMLVFGALFLALPLIAAAIWASSLGARLDLGSPWLLYIMLGSIPFCAPLNILRGVALGRIDSGKMVLSANVEMAVRLGFGALAWVAGLGIEGVVAAIGLSIIAGWAVLTGLLAPISTDRVALRPVAATLGLTALPYALLQLAQIVSLDGDIFLASRFLGNAETGLVAALSLFQRIQFFACYGLAAVLLPAVITALRNKQSYMASVWPILALLGAVSVTVLGLTTLIPETMISLAVGPDYAAAAPHLKVVAAISVLFTVNYLIATFLMALGDRMGILAVMATAIVQTGLMVWTLLPGTADLAAMLDVKLICQPVLLLILLARTYSAVSLSTPR